ncbi:ABC transporter permease [Lapidilactobacillus bayanensis]|uniref:ABC transporter permease n=1 Tax=Lapidilactobacillus bayanensis TaxID=2485998 RepID=UPI000F777EBD|nr:ABC transporter permease [Lapidilactobacillus bayanensis]
MYLAYHELKSAKARYGLVVITLFLVAYLIYFLTGLAYGLANNNRVGVDQWHAQRVTMSKYADHNLQSSTIIAGQFDRSDLSKNVAPLGLLAGEVNQKSDNTDLDTYVFGINFSSFIKPQLTSGRQARHNNEVVVDQRLGTGQLKLGTKIKINGSSTYYKVVGLTKNNLFGTLPITFTTLGTYNKLRFGSTTVKNMSAVVYKNATDVVKKSGLETTTVQTMVENIPGYTAQNSTFSLMIGALFIIVLFVVGIFMYILTIQNVSVYGVMRAQGISNGTLIRSVLAQSLLLGIIGVGLGLFANQLTVLILPAAMPYTNNTLLVGGFTVGLLAVVVLGSVFSIKRILKIDPLDAIGGAA